jgi:hypothetical protein
MRMVWPMYLSQSGGRSFCPHHVQAPRDAAPAGVEAIQPARKNDTPSQMAGFSCQNDEDGLRDFPGLMRVAGVARRDRIDLVDGPGDELGKGFFGMVLDVIPQQGDVIQFLHLRLNAAVWEKVTSFFRRNLKPRQMPGIKFIWTSFDGMNILRLLAGAKAIV